MTTKTKRPALPTCAMSASLAAFACFVATAVVADPVVMPAAKPPEAVPPIPQRPLVLDWSPSPELLGFASAARDPLSAAPPGSARGNELSTIATVELARTDRRFRARIVDWFSERSVAAGLASDVIVHGSDTGVHLHLQHSEYLMRWETRF
jgi:hypothetical protein